MRPKFFQRITFATATFCTASTWAAICNHDNCLRALNPTGRPGRASFITQGSVFCSTLTKSTTTPTNLPAYATSACGSDLARYSSACSCAFPASTQVTTAKATSTPFCQAANAVQNGDFETKDPGNPPIPRYGIVPAWTRTFDEYHSDDEIFPSDITPYEGKQAARFIAWAGDASYPCYAKGTLSQDVPIVKGKDNVLNFWYRLSKKYLDEASGRFIVRIDGMTYLDIGYFEGPKDWTQNTFKFSSNNGSSTAHLEFIADSAYLQEIIIDLDDVFIPLEHTGGLCTST